MCSRWVALAVLALSVVVLPCATARAEPRDPSAAEALFRAGREAFEKGDYATALGRFDEAYRLDPTPGALLNRAICEDELGQLTRAWEDYRRVLERLPAEDPRLEIASGRLRALEQRLAWVTIKLESGAAAGTTVKRGSVELGSASLGVALPLDPGRHEFVVSAPGRGSRSYPLNLVEGERRELLVGSFPEPATSQPQVSDSPTVIPPASDSNRPAADWTTTAPSVGDTPDSPTLGYVLLGAGGLGLGVAAVSGILLLDRMDTVDDHCQEKLCDQVGYDAGRSGRTLRAIAGVSLAAGALSAGVGGYLVLSSKGTTTEVSWRGSF
jgi:hypothetical protein